MKDELNLVWASDDNYAFLAGVSLTSVLINNQDYEIINVWILDDNISMKEKEQLKSCVARFDRNIAFIDTQKSLEKIKNLNARSWGKAKSYSAYSRLFLADMLQEYDVERVIYIDCDIVFDGSIREIAEWNLENKPLAMAIDYNRLEIRELLNLHFDDRYYNSGLIVMDLTRWKECQCTERILEHMTCVGANYPFVDQDLINCVLKNGITLLPLKYNVNPRVMQYSYKHLCKIYGMNEKNYYSQSEYDEVRREKPVGYHCSDPAAGRPWEENSNHIYTEIWNRYFEKSVWYGNYTKKAYKRIRLVMVQQFLEKILPGWLYVRVLRYAAKKSMKKLIIKYRKLNSIKS